MSSQAWCGTLKQDNSINIIICSISPAKAGNYLSPKVFTNKKCRSGCVGRCMVHFRKVKWKPCPVVGPGMTLYN